MKKIYEFIRRYRSSNSGTTAIEFALISFPYLFMILGTMEAGRVIWTINTVQYAVEATSRYAALDATLTNADLQTYAGDKLQGLAVDIAPLQISPTYNSVSGSSGVDFVEIQGRYQITLLVDMLMPNGSGTFEFSTLARKPIIN